MPELVTVRDFLEVTREDFRSPTTSEFVSKIPLCRNSVASIEDALDGDREGLMKMKKSLKGIHQSGLTNVESELSLSKALERLGTGSQGQEPELETAFFKFAVVTRDLSNLKKTLMQNLQNMILFPLDSVLKGEIKGVKGDLKRPLDKALKEYEARHAKLEKEKKSLAQHAGMLRKEVTPAEIADETERERRLLQLHLTEYYLKVNEIRTKKGVELLKHLVEYYHALNSYFQDGLKTMEHFGNYVTELSTNLTKIRQHQDEEKKSLTEMRNLLRTTPLLEKELTTGNSGNSGPPSYSLHQMIGNKSLGVTKIGYLNKKSDGKMRRVWQKRKCAVQDGFLHIFHGDESKQPSRVNLLTCQLKVVSEDRRFFDLVSYNRTYHLNSEEEAEEWISVILNSKEAAMEKAFDPEVDNNGLKWRELTQAILGHVHHLPGNTRCADCDSENDVTWLSVNLGVIVCIECSGIHRTLGVGISRIQSIYLDHIPPSLLILSVRIGNSAMNNILEENLKPGVKPVQSSTMDERKDYIRAKYIEKKFVAVSADSEQLSNVVDKAIESSDLLLLVRAWAQGVNLAAPLRETGETALHLAILRGYLPIVDFLVHNAGALDKKTKNGSTPLHYCAFYGRTEPAKLILRAGSDLQTQDKDKLTPLDVAKLQDNKGVEELLLHAMEGKKTLFECVDFDWNLGTEDSTDISEDEITALDDATTPEKSRRPNSFFIDSPYKFTNSEVFVGTPESTVSSKGARSKRNAPAPPETSHIRSPSDPMIAKLNLGPRVLPLEQPAPLKRTSIPSNSSSTIQPSSTFSHLQSQYGAPFNILGNLVNSNAGVQHSSTVATISSPTVIAAVPNGNKIKTPVFDPDNYRKCRAIYDCKADNSDEISFHQGEIIYILNERTQDEDWMEGLIVDGNRRGMFPVSFVEFLE